METEVQSNATARVLASNPLPEKFCSYRTKRRNLEDWVSSKYMLVSIGIAPQHKAARLPDRVAGWMLDCLWNEVWGVDPSSIQTSKYLPSMSENVGISMLEKYRSIVIHRPTCGNDRSWVPRWIGSYRLRQKNVEPRDVCVMGVHTTSTKHYVGLKILHRSGRHIPDTLRVDRHYPSEVIVESRVDRWVIRSRRRQQSKNILNSFGRGPDGSGIGIKVWDIRHKNRIVKENGRYIHWPSAPKVRMSSSI